MRSVIMRFRLFLTVALLFVLVVVSSYVFTGCASRSAPSGGEKDTLAAGLDTSFPPNQSIYFTAKEITLIFDEYINLKSAQRQILISPPLAEPLEIEARAREVIITLNDSLRANTTYIISFGEAVTDYTEGNVTKNLKYVFSTGSYIDSLSLSGTVKQAFSGTADEDLLVALYNVNQIEKPDSFLYQQLPNYYANLTEEGTFTMTNLKAGQYRLVAFADRGGDFKLNTGKERFAFWPEVINLQPDSTYQYNLRSYEPAPEFRFYNARHKAKGKIVFAFSAPADSFSIDPLNIPADSSFFESNAKNDTLTFWFNCARDSAKFRLNGAGFTDSVITVFLRKYQEPNLELKAQKTDLRSFDTLVLESNLPLLNFTKDSIFYYGKDTLNQAIVLDSARGFKGYVYPPFRQDFSLKLMGGAVQSWINAQFDSADFTFKVLKKDDLGTLNFTVKADTGFAYELKMQTEGGKLLLTQHFEDSLTVQLKNYLPGKLKAFLVQDLNRDKSYTPGDFETGRLPEPRIIYKEEIEIRANWELDLLWQVKSLRD